MKNKDAFIPESVFDESIIDEYKKEYFFEEYGFLWFKKIKDIRKYLKEWFGQEYKIIKVYGDGWNIEKRSD